MGVCNQAGVRSVGLAVAGLILWNTLPLVAQEPETPRATTPAAAPTPATPQPAADSSRRVPDYFGQIGLTNDQKEAIYKVRGSHLNRIDELQDQISKLRAQMMTECEAVLTADQKTQLNSRRRSAEIARKEKAKVKAAGVKSAPAPSQEMTPRTSG